MFLFFSNRPLQQSLCSRFHSPSFPTYLQDIAEPVCKSPRTPLFQAIPSGRQIAPSLALHQISFSEETMNVKKILGIVLLMSGATSCAMAVPASTPEVVAGTAGSALALVSGIVLMIRGRRK
jgi:hypothetical protein